MKHTSEPALAFPVSGGASVESLAPNPSACPVEHVAAELDAAQIRWCIWKGSSDLQKGLRGEDDIDLLIERRSLARAESLLLAAGFKRGRRSRLDATAGTSHLYHYVPSIARFIHLHVYSGVVTGENYVESHRLPLENLFFENTLRAQKLRVASPESQLIGFVLKTMIRYGSPFDLRAQLKKIESIKSDFLLLENASDRREVLRLLRHHSPWIEVSRFCACLDALGTDQSLLERIRLGVALRRDLRSFRTQSTAARLGAYASLLYHKCMRRLRGAAKTRALDHGGAIIAFVGPDATGKSTLVSAAASWVGHTFPARIVHVGKPPSAMLTRPLNFGLAVFRRLRSRQSIRSAGRKETTNGTSRSPERISFRYALRAVALAWDRSTLIARVRRCAARGELILCDRYPTEAFGAMDSPRIAMRADAGTFKARAWNLLGRCERRLYRMMPPPDIALRLRVSLPVAMERNRTREPNERDPERYLEERHRKAGDWERTGTAVIKDINTDGDLDRTVVAVRQAIWESL